MKFEQLKQELENAIQESYEAGVSMEEAEKLASKFLYAQLAVSKELSAADLDARMRKSGVKALRAAAYKSAIAGQEKKPTENAIEHAINTDADVSGEQDAYDKADTNKSELERLYSVYQNAHIHFRTIAKGQFGA